MNRDDAIKKAEHYFDEADRVMNQRVTSQDHAVGDRIIGRCIELGNGYVALANLLSAGGSVATEAEQQ